MTLLPCAVVFDELSPAFPQLSSQVLHVLTFQEKQNTLFDTALLRVVLSFWRGKRPKFNCIQMRLFFPSEFSFLLLKQKEINYMHSPS